MTFWDVAVAVAVGVAMAPFVYHAVKWLLILFAGLTLVGIAEALKRLFK